MKNINTKIYITVRNIMKQYDNTSISNVNYYTHFNIFNDLLFVTIIQIT